MKKIALVLAVFVNVTCFCQSVTFYENLNYTGQSLILGIGLHTLPDNFQNKISSIKIPDNLEVEVRDGAVYFNFSVNLNYDYPDLAPLGINDKIKFVRIRQKDVIVTLFEQKNYSGKSRYFSSDDFQNLNSGYRFYTPVDFNDLTSSIKIKQGYAVKAYIHADRKSTNQVSYQHDYGYGEYIYLDSDNPDLGKFDKKISFIEVFKIPSCFSNFNCRKKTYEFFKKDMNSLNHSGSNIELAFTNSEHGIVVWDNTSYLQCKNGKLKGSGNLKFSNKPIIINNVTYYFDPNNAEQFEFEIDPCTDKITWTVPSWSLTNTYDIDTRAGVLFGFGNVDVLTIVLSGRFFPIQ